MTKNIRIHLHTFVLLFAMTICTGTSHARWANYQDANAEIEFSNNDITVHADGTSEEVVEQQVKILKEQGREVFGNAMYVYKGASRKIEILEAKTIHEGIEYPVDKKTIETKPLASSPQGFDQNYQILISYPKVEVGSQVYIKLKITTFKQPLDNFFADTFTFNQNAYLLNSSTIIKSALPLNIKINDPHDKLEFLQDTDNGVQILSFSLKEPMYENIINESQDAVINPKHLTWVEVSSVDNFQDFGKAFAPKYERVINQPLPPLLKTIKNAAQNTTGEVDQINKVTSMLAEKIRYMGDWASVNGGFFPRDLDTITHSGVGDCKDFSISTAAILKNLGYKVQSVLVHRGSPYLSPEDPLPILGLFNHAILKATGKSGKVYWIDPTNLKSMAGGIFPDIANRYALVLDSKEPSYEFIPDINFESSKSITTETLSIEKDDIIKVSGKIYLFGAKASTLTGLTLVTSPQTVEEAIILSLSGEASPLEKKVKLPDLNSRIVKDLHIEYAYKQENMMLRTNLGTGLVLEPKSWVKRFLATSEDQVSELFIGLPETITKKVSIKNATKVQAQSLNCHIKTPWLEVSRAYSNNNHDMTVTDTAYILKSFITNEELKTQAYKDLKNNLKKCFNNVAVIVKKD